MNTERGAPVHTPLRLKPRCKGHWGRHVSAQPPLQKQVTGKFGFYTGSSLRAPWRRQVPTGGQDQATCQQPRAAPVTFTLPCAPCSPLMGRGHRL